MGSARSWSLNRGRRPTLTYIFRPSLGFIESTPPFWYALCWLAAALRSETLRKASLVVEHCVGWMICQRSQKIRLIQLDRRGLQRIKELDVVVRLKGVGDPMLIAPILHASQGRAGRGKRLHIIIQVQGAALQEERGVEHLGAVPAACPDVLIGIVVYALLSLPSCLLAQKQRAAARCLRHASRTAQPLAFQRKPGALLHCWRSLPAPAAWSWALSSPWPSPLLWAWLQAWPWAWTGIWGGAF